MYDIDFIDRQLISILRDNARTSISELAKSIGVSRATVQNRLNRLETEEIITGYTAIISTATSKVVAAVRAQMSLELNGTSNAAIKSKLLQEPAVVAIHSTNGRWGMIIELESESLEAFDKVLGRIRSIPEITNSETRILLSSHRVKSS